jgi:hypothetical protein
MKNPKYLKIIDISPIHKLTFKHDFIQLSPSYYFYFDKKIIINTYMRINRGKDHPYAC